MTNLLQLAISYLERGWSVIPVSKTKIPIIQWKEYTERHPTIDELKKWFGDEKLENQIGIVCGSVSGLTVVDIEAEGDFSLIKDKTFRVKTGGGGIHVYFSYDPEFQNAVRLLPFLDIRNDSGYVIAAGSTSIKGDYTPLNDLDVVAMSSETKRLLLGSSTQQSSKHWDFKLLDGVAQGSRNESAARVIGKVLSLYPVQEWGEAWEFIRSWNEMKNSPPLPEWELHNVFLSIARRQTSKSPNALDVVKKIEKSSPRITLTTVIEEASKEILGTKASDIVSFGYDFLDEQLTGIFRGELIIVGGESGTGKTTLATNIIYKNSKNRKCYIFALEDRLNYYGAKCLFFKINELRKSAGRKMYPWNAFIRNEIQDPEYKAFHDSAKRELVNENIEFYASNELMTIETMENVITNKISEGVELFLIDHLHYFDLSRGSQTKSDYVEQVMVKLKTIQNKTGARIILVVHFRKLNGQKPSLDSFKDSISIVQNANYVINLWRDRSLNPKTSKSEKPDPFEDLFSETELYIPKARNPNGEASFVLKFDKATNDYVRVSKNFGTPQGTVTQEEINF